MLHVCANIFRCFGSVRVRPHQLSWSHSFGRIATCAKLRNDQENGFSAKRMTAQQRCVQHTSVRTKNDNAPAPTRNIIIREESKLWSKREKKPVANGKVCLALTRSMSWKSDVLCMAKHYMFPSWVCMHGRKQKHWLSLEPFFVHFPRRNWTSGATKFDYVK